MKKRIVITGGTGRLVNELKKVKTNNKLFFPKKKKLKKLFPKQIIFNFKMDERSENSITNVIKELKKKNNYTAMICEPDGNLIKKIKKFIKYEKINPSHFSVLNEY